jgi:hypothetical protein
VLTVAALVLSGCSGVSEAPEGADSSAAPTAPTSELASRLLSKPEPITVPAGTTVLVRLDQSISSATAQAGDTFSGSLGQSLTVNGRTVAPQGAVVTGKVLAARKSGRLKDPGYLRIGLAAVEMGEEMVPVSSSNIFIKGKGHTKRNVAWIGGGAAGGALIGGLAGGGKGALIGSAVGAGGGTATAYATGKKDVMFAAERQLTFRLTESVTVEQ